MEQYVVVRTVGRGSYGEVQLVRHGRDVKQYVVKKLNLRSVSGRERKAAEQEAQLLSQLRHPNIVTYRESWEGDDGILYIVMGYCEGGDLYHKLKEQKGKLLPESQVVEWFVQIAMALQYLHEKQILHRDLKTQNIFLTKSNIIKVGDLGIARVLEHQHDMASTLIGTPYYMSPELFCNKPYNHKSDVWALGCCAFEMATLKHAFNAKDMNSLVFKIIEGKLPPIPKEYSQQLGQLISSMLSRRPEERPDVKAILRKSYIRSHIALFLEATKAKAIKSRKKAAVPILTKCESRITLQDLDPSRRFIKKEENESKKTKPNYISYTNQPEENSSNISHQALNSSSGSLATISKVHIDDIVGLERRNSNPGKVIFNEPALHFKNCVNAESKVLVAGAQADDIERRNGVMVERKVEKSRNQILDELLDRKDNTFKLLQPIFKEEHSPELQVNFDSTEKLLQPFEAIKITEDSSENVKKPIEENPIPFSPHCSSSEPSVSRQYRQNNNELLKKTEKDRPLSARERRRLKQSREEFPYSVSTSRRNSHCGALEPNSCEENQNVKAIQSLSDVAIHQGKCMSELSHHLSDDDEYSSSASSTDRSEGDCKDVKPDSSEIHDLVKLMTQTLKRDSKDANEENPFPARTPEFKLQRKYRDTLILHGKSEEEPEDFCFNDFPTEVPSKIKRTIEALRIDVLKGLGVKLLEKVYNIMEDDNEARREESLQEEMGEELYQNYSMKVKQLKFFEDNSNF
ncbi:serine/threonine-protein kinase Nek4 isoform X1 [Hemitrygon akajei]|uniref:serine/threonine-protein kinase Nek4 isoform X1 n=1 Tax=Hemitrygon akajei TaxID=2704970 RepID=UPI003BF9492B